MKTKDQLQSSEKVIPLSNNEAGMLTGGFIDISPEEDLLSTTVAKNRNCENQNCSLMVTNGGKMCSNTNCSGCTCNSGGHGQIGNSGC